MEKVEVRSKVIECYGCHHITLTLVRKAWKKNPLRNCKELRGHYKCSNCGFNCSKVFATELI